MPFIEGCGREQTILFPEVLDDYVGVENPVRFIDDAFVRSLDLRELGFERAIPLNTGRPPYDPADLLALFPTPDLTDLQRSLPGGQRYRCVFTQPLGVRRTGRRDASIVTLIRRVTCGRTHAVVWTSGEISIMHANRVSC